MKRDIDWLKKAVGLLYPILFGLLLK